MTLVKWHPNNSLRTWNSFDNLVRDFFDNGLEDTTVESWTPSIDIDEDEIPFSEVR